MKRLVATVVILLALAFTPLSCRPDGIKVGSKKFTESVVLGEMLKSLSEDAGTPATHYRELGGTKLVFQALLNGDVDVYPEYTGTIVEEILGLGPDEPRSLEAMRGKLAKRGILISEPLGFNNTYALGMLDSRAAELQVETISDLVRHPDLVCGFASEFMDRQDGWPNLQRHYNLPQRQVSGLDHDLAYRQLKLKSIDITDAYTTDAKISTYHLRLLEDDRDYFPRYDAVLLYREDLAKRFPDVQQSILQLESAIDEKQMVAANSRVEVDGTSESQVAVEFLQEELNVVVEFTDSTVVSRITQRTIEHFDLVRKSLIPAILIAIPLGILAAKMARSGQFILAIVGIIQTIPSLALLVVLMPAMAALGLASLGLGSATAVTALLLYSLLPMVRNTYSGLSDVAGEYHESAVALGLPPWYRLMKIELPLASRSILSGIKTAAVINVGFATLGALIGAGGYGQPILTGIRLNDTGSILEGAIPAAVLALAVQGAFEASDRFFVPRGLRMKRDE